MLLAQTFANDDTSGVTIDKWAVAIEPFEDEAPSFYRWPTYEVRHMPSMNSNACT